MKIGTVKQFLLPLIGAVAVLRCVAQDQEPLYYTTFDSVDAVENPKAGSAGVCDNVTFVDGMTNSAMYVPAHAVAARIPFPDGLPVERGTIEFWAKMNGTKQNYGVRGDPVFFRFGEPSETHIESPTVMVEFNANNGGGRGGLLAKLSVFEISPEKFSRQMPYSTYIPESELATWHHYALVWNTNGISAVEGNPRVALLLDGNLVCSAPFSDSWDADTFVAEMSKEMYMLISDGRSEYSNEPFAIDELKVWGKDIVPEKPEPEDPEPEEPEAPENPEPLYYTTFDSTDAVRAPVVGPQGTCGNATFVAGKTGNALQVPVYQTVAEIPFDNGLPVECGTIEFWAKMTLSKTYFIDGGNPCFLCFVKPSENITTAFVEFNANNGGGRGGLVGRIPAISLAPAVYRGSMPYSDYIDESKLEAWHHYAIVWNTNGIAALEGKPNGALFLDGNVVCTANLASGWNQKDYVDEMSSPMVLNISNTTRPGYSKVPYAIDELKVWGKDVVPEKPEPEDPDPENPEDPENPPPPVEPTIITNFVYTTVTNEIHHYTTVTNTVNNYNYSTVTNEVFHHVTNEVRVTNDIHHYSTVTNEVFNYLTVTNEINHYFTITNEIFHYVTNEVHHFMTVTNDVCHYSTVTNVFHEHTTVTNVVEYVPEPGASPAPGYEIAVGVSGKTVIAGAAGWDAIGVPDGMSWNSKTGTLSGRAKLSGTYDLILVSGSGASTRFMRTTITVAPYNNIVGYVGVAFSSSDAVLASLTSYKTLPAGLKWKNGVLSGVPAKAQKITYATKGGEPVTIEIKPLPAVATGAYAGAVYSAGAAAGRITLSVAASGAVSGKIYEGGRVWTLSAANFSADSDVAKGTMRAKGTAARTASGKTYKQQWSFTIALDGDAEPAGATSATGTLGATLVFEASRNFWKDSGAAALLSGWTGEYAWTAPDGGKLTFVLNASGTVKIAGALSNGRAISVSTPLFWRDGVREVFVYAPAETVKIKSGKKTVNKKYAEFIAVVRLSNEPGIPAAGGDTAYRFR